MADKNYECLKRKDFNILPDKMTDKDIERLKKIDVYLEENKYIGNKEIQKLLKISDSTERRL